MLQKNDLQSDIGPESPQQTHILTDTFCPLQYVIEKSTVTQLSH